MRQPQAFTYHNSLTYLRKCLQDINLFYLTSPNRRKLEHFIDRESRESQWTPRESEFTLAKRLQDTSTLLPSETDTKGMYARDYYKLLWIYNICVVFEYAIAAKRRSLLPLLDNDIYVWQTVDAAPKEA